MFRRERIVKMQKDRIHFPETLLELLHFVPNFALPMAAFAQTAFDALAAACDFGPLRFSKNLANMALARAGKSR